MQSNVPLTRPGAIVFLIGSMIAMVHLGIVNSYRAPQGSSPPYIRNTFLLWRFMTFGGHPALKDDTLNLICRVDIALQLILFPLFGATIYLLASHR